MPIKKCTKRKNERRHDERARHIRIGALRLTVEAHEPVKKSDERQSDYRKSDQGGDNEIVGTRKEKGPKRGTDADYVNRQHISFRSSQARQSLVLVGTKLVSVMISVSSFSTSCRSRSVRCAEIHDSISSFRS